MNSPIYTPAIISFSPETSSCSEPSCFAAVSFRQNRFPPRQIGIHQALEEFAVIGNLEVEEFVDDNIFLERFRFLKNIGAETDPPLT